MPGIEFYRGLSQLDKSPVVGIATNNSKNIKTGDMIQTWILLQEVNPISGVSLNFDEGICGDCKHRKGICYVDISKAPHNIWKSWYKGLYPIDNTFSFFENKLIRLAAYGDPTVIPLKVWGKILKNASGFTGYTHQWSKKRFQAYKNFCMASVDSEAEYYRAKALGWRTFRIKNPQERKFRREINCPASPDSVTKLTCETCLFCNGLKGLGRKDVSITVHGLPYKVSNFQKLSLPLVSS